MKIKTILKATIILSLMIFVGVGINIYSVIKKTEQAKISADIAVKINNTIYHLNALSSDYLLYYQARASQQWKNTHSQLNKVLGSSDISYLKDVVDLTFLKNTHARSLRLFERIEHVRSQEEKNKSVLLEEQRKALSSLLLSTSYQMSLTASTLSDVIEVKRNEIKQQLFLLIIIVCIVFVVTLLASWILIAYRIVIPVNLMKKHILSVDAEHLNDIYKYHRDDEVGELITSFNRMAENLFQTTVSKEKLKEEIEERKRYERELKEQESLNSAILENAGNVIVILDTEGRIVKFNHSAELSTGFSRDELLGKPIWDYVIPKEQYEGVKNVFDTLKQGNTAIAGNYENHWITKSGEYRLFDWHNTILRNNNDEITHVIAIGYDITEKRNAEIEKQRMQRELDQSHKMEALGKLTGGIAHDFNNMLGIILGYSELAFSKSKKNTDTSIPGYIEQVIIASNRAKELIAKMLTFSRVDQSGSHMIQLSPLLNENIKLMRSVLPSTIKVEYDNEKNIPDIIMDPVQLQQVVMNLMINAKDAMDGVGTIKLSLANYYTSGQECSTCHKKLVGDWVEIKISDNGKGMSEDIKKRIFEPFFTTKILGEGTGMGLSVIHGIVIGHHGHIMVESIEGKGTSFQLLFPVTINKDKSIENEKAEESKNLHGNGQRILIIDDEKSLADLQCDLLDANGYQCIKKYDSLEALELYLSGTADFDLIITDQTMPNLTGLELIDEIRSKNLNIPIIISTGYSDKIKGSVLDIKGVVLLKKPVDSKKLLEQVYKSLASQDCN